MPGPTQLIELSEPLSSAIARVAEGWTPSLPRLRLPSRLMFRSRDIASEVRKVTFTRSCLEFDCEGKSHGFAQPKSGQLEEISGSFESGWDFRGRAFISKLSFGSTVKYMIRCHNWHFREPTRAPVFWCAQIEDRLPFFTGNLDAVLATDDDGIESWHSGYLHVRSPRRSYCLVNSGTATTPSWQLLFEAGPDIDLDELGSAQMALSFCLGARFTVSALYGITDEAQCCEVVDSGQRSTSDRPLQLPPVPISDGPNCWPAALFGRLTQALDGAPRVLTTAVAYYLAAASGSVDTQYLNLRVGLETVARWIVAARDTALLSQARSGTEWDNWFEAAKPTIAGLARQGREQALLASVYRAERSAAATLIEDAASLLSLSLPPACADELQQIDDILFAGVISGESKDGLWSSLARVSALRSMMASVLARAVGYFGPVLQPSTKAVDAFQPRYSKLDRDAAEADEVARDAETRYRAKGRSGSAPAEGYWPQFEMPQIPDSGMFRTLTNFANELGKRTAEQVICRVQYSLPPSSPALTAPPSSDDSVSDLGSATTSAPEYMADVVVALATNPAIQTTLFTVISRPDGLVVLGWWDEELTVPDDASLQDFLREVARSEMARARVQALLTMARAARPS